MPNKYSTDKGMQKLFEGFRRSLGEIRMLEPTPTEELSEEGAKLADILSSSGEWQANLAQVLELNDMMGYPLPMRDYVIHGDGGDRYAVLEFDTKADKELWADLLSKAGLKSHNEQDYSQHSLVVVDGKDGAEYHAIYIDNPL